MNVSVLYWFNIYVPVRGPCSLKAEKNRLVVFSKYLGRVLVTLPTLLFGLMSRRDKVTKWKKRLQKKAPGPGTFIRHVQPRQLKQPGSSELS